MLEFSTLKFTSSLFLLTYLDAWKKKFDIYERSNITAFLQQVSPDMEEKRYEIDGDRIYARVMRYNTSLRENCKIEAHNKYIDIQSSIIGCEGIDIFNREILVAVDEYNAQKDVIHYNKDTEPYISIKNLPGYFSMIFPNEAHQPQISVDRKCDLVKKFVIKILV